MVFAIRWHESAMGAHMFPILTPPTTFLPIIFSLFLTGLPGCSVKNLPTMQETQETCVWSLGQEDPLDEQMAIHSRILAWRIPWMEEPARLQSMWLQSQTQLSMCSHTHTHTHTFNRVVGHFVLHCLETLYISIPFVIYYFGHTLL